MNWYWKDGTVALEFGRSLEPVSAAEREAFRLLSERMADPAYKLIGLTRVSESRQVSTVWLGLGHPSFDGGPPFIFETAVFGFDDGADDHVRIVARYRTEEEARRGHEAVVADCGGMLP